VNVPNYQKNDTIIKSPQFPGGEDAWEKYLKENLNYSLPLDSGGLEAKKIFKGKGKNGIIFISTKWQEKN
jgi:hypothetical protein